MVTKVNDIELRILSLYTKSYNKEYYIREIEKLLTVSSRTALVTLRKLEAKGILESKTRGKIKVYAIRNTGITVEYLTLTEQYKKIRLFEKDYLIKEVLEKVCIFAEGLVLVFGSYAKNTQKEDSDLDLFIVGKHDKKKIIEIGEMYGVEIQVISYSSEAFEKGIHIDVFVKELLENHIIIKGSEYFVSKVVQWTK